MGSNGQQNVYINTEFGFRTLKKHLLLKILFTSFFLLISFMFVQSQGKAAETDHNFMKGLASTLHLEMDNETDLTDMAARAFRERLYDKVLYSSSRLRVSLSDHLRLFFNFQSPIKYYPGKEEDEKSCTIFGMDILF